MLSCELRGALVVLAVGFESQVSSFGVGALPRQAAGMRSPTPAASRTRIMRVATNGAAIAATIATIAGSSIGVDRRELVGGGVADSMSVEADDEPQHAPERDQYEQRETDAGDPALVIAGRRGQEQHGRADRERRDEKERCAGSNCLT